MLDGVELMTIPSQKQVWSYASRYLAAGFSIIPCKRNKRPDLQSWQEYTIKRANERDIFDWFSPDSDYKRLSQSIGFVCGKISGNLLVVDLDGIGAIRKFAAQFPKLCENTKSVLTGSQVGIHLYFKVKELPANINVRVKNVGGFELRGNGQYVIAPPSPHESGYFYKVHRENPILERDNMNDVVDWMQSLREYQQAERQAEISQNVGTVHFSGTSKRNENYLKKVVSEEIARITTSGQGNRNNSLFYAAMRLANYAAGGELDWNEMSSLLALATDLPVSEAKQTIASAYRIGSKRPKTVK